MAIRGSAPVDERRLFGEYPFLPGAERLVESMHVSVRELLSAPAFGRARELGRARALAAAENPRGTTALDELERADPDERFLSFLFARLVLSTATHPAALRRWAVAEAKRAHLRLERARPEELAEVARRLGFLLEESGPRTVRLELVDYVRLAVPIREADFRLGAQAVHHGRVELEAARASRLLQEAVRLELAAPRAGTPEVEAEVRAREGPFLQEIARRTPLLQSRSPVGAVTIQPARFPPCIRKMRRTLEAGENLSHSGRFALAAFLHRAGADPETIVDAYRGAPDFDESITRYQVDHITRHDGGRGYEPPECETLRSHGLCARDGDPAAPQPVDRAPEPRCFEPSLRHPLQFYRERGGRVVEDRLDAERVTRPGAGGGRTPSAPARRRSTAPRR
ncbi:MAG: hypothetical protein ACREBT_02525 [Thermoplasmata archaeon]